MSGISIIPPDEKYPPLPLWLLLPLIMPPDPHADGPPRYPANRRPLVQWRRLTREED